MAKAAISAAISTAVAGALAALLFPEAAAAQTHPISIHPNQRVASLLMSPAEYADWKANDGFSDGAKCPALVQELYRTFRDDFDFIFLILDEPVIPAGLPYYGKLIPIANATIGLGLGAFDRTKDYGSAGRLKSVMALAELDDLAYGPSLHELMHTWGNYGIQAGAYGPDGNAGGTAYADYRPHWGFTGGNVPGQLGGFKQSTLKENVGGNPKRYQADAFGPYANGGNSKPYSQMELYLAGFLPAGQVTPFDVFRDITAFNDSSFTWEADTRIRYDSARILSELGPRSPGYATAQKDFRLLIVVLSDKPLSDSAWSAIDRDAERFCRPRDDGTGECNFWEATGGRATLGTGQLSASLLNPISIRPKPPLGSLSGKPSEAERFFNALGRNRLWDATPSFRSGIRPLTNTLANPRPSP